jgi:hypothetical protein
MTAPALPLRPASKRWEAPPQCPLRAASRPRCISDTPVSNPYALRSSNLLGLGTFQEPWAEAYYQRKRQEGKTHTWRGARLRHVWVRISYALWRKHEPYQAAIFLAAQQAHRCLAA